MKGEQDLLENTTPMVVVRKTGLTIVKNVPDIGK